MFRTPHAVVVLGANPLPSYDDYGNPIPGEPIEDEQAVYGWAPAGTSEFDDRQEQVTHDLDLYAPPGFRVTAADRVRVVGDVYEVEGRVQDFNHGPFGFTPGVRVKLRRVTG